MTIEKSKQLTLWIITIGLLLILSGCGSGSSGDADAIANDKATMEAMATAIAVEKNEPSPTATPLPPTATSAPTSTPPPTATPPAKEATGDSLTLATPTPVPEGIIVFLSSRDHPRTEEEIRDHSGAHDLELYGMRPDGSQQTRLSDGTLGLSNYSPPPLTSYSANGQIVINERFVFDLRARQMVEELVTSQTIDGLPLVFARGSSSGNPLFFAIDPVWSSTNEIAFMGMKSGSSSGIYYLSSLESKPVRLTTPPDDVWGDGFAAWSPDGDRIVFGRQWNDTNQDGLWIIAKDGSEMRRLVTSDLISNGTRQPAWSPDGRTIAYEGPKENTQHYNFELWTVDVAGQSPRQLTDLPEQEGIWGPVWSPDSRQIAFTLAPGGMVGSQADVYTIDADGGEPRQLTFDGYTNLVPLWLPLDADEILAGGDTPLQTPPTPTPRPQPQQPQPVKATSCPSPGVQISSPTAGSRFTQQNNFIVGTANIPRFHHWRIEYSTDLNGGWNYLLERDYPVDNDKLVMIDASTIPNGPYGLRLTVVDETGNYPEPCEVWFTNGY